MSMSKPERDFSHVYNPMFDKDLAQNEIEICEETFMNKPDSAIIESKVLEYKVNGVKQTNTKAYSMLMDLYSKTDRSTLYKESSHSITEDKIRGRNGNGYHYYPKIGLSFQTNKSRKAVIKEIIKFIKINRYSMELELKLKTGEIFILNIRVPVTYNLIEF